MTTVTRLDALTGTAIARRGMAIAAASTVVALASIARPASSPQEWVGWFPSTISASESIVSWAPSALAVFAAWISGQVRTHGMQDLESVSPRSRRQLIAPALLMSAIAAVLGQAAGLLAMFSASAVFGMTGKHQPAVLLLSLPTVTSYLLAWVAFGVIVGRVGRREVALATAAVAPYAVFALLAYSTDSPLGSIALGDGRIFDYVRPSSSMILTRLCFWGLLAAALWAFLLRTRRLARALTWGCSAAAAVALFQGPAIVPLPGATDPHCGGSSPVTCLDTSHASSMGRYRDAISELWPDVPIALRPDVVASGVEVARPKPMQRLLIAAPVAGFTEPARLVDQRMFAARFGNALFLSPCAAQGQVSEGAFELLLWWRLEQDVPMNGEAFAGDVDITHADPRFADHLAAAQEFSRWPDADREQWFSTHAAQVRDCSVGPLQKR